MEVIADGTRFIRRHQRGRLGLQSANQLVEVRLACADRAEQHGRIRGLSDGLGDGDRIFVNVQINEKRCRLCHG